MGLESIPTPSALCGFILGQGDADSAIDRLWQKIKVEVPTTVDEISIQVQMKVKGNEDDHSLMVEKKISDNDFCSSEDITEALFGYIATNRKSPVINKNSSNKNKNKIKISTTDPTAQIFILEPQKSESISMILRSLFVTRKEILDVLLQGRMSFDLDTLEKLTRISPTQDEQEQIFEFNGNQTKLADSESFIYHLLKAVSFPFDRLNSLFFRSKYESKILFLKKSLEILELGCIELRVNGVFFNLLESIIKTQWSTTMDQEFSFGELLNISDVKNIDRNSNLLQFVVVELVKSEGKNFINKQSQNFDQRNTQKNKTRNSRTQIEKPKEEREDHEYLKLGLPIVEGICKELSYAKKSALIDCNTYEKTWVEIKAGFTQIKDLLKKINNGGKEDDDGFVRKMKRFLYRSEKEFKVLRESEKRLMKILKNTIELYFESGKASLFDDDDQNENPVLLFVMVKDFISMVDHVCINIAMKLKKTEKEGLRFQRLSSIL